MIANLNSLRSYSSMGTKAVVATWSQLLKDHNPNLEGKKLDEDDPREWRDGHWDKIFEFDGAGNVTCVGKRRRHQFVLRFTGTHI